jgi:cleavage stimulation factor subunit 3
LNTANPVKSESQERPQSPEPHPPPSEYDLLNKQVADNPHDHDAWRRFVDVAEETGDIDKISATYDALLKQFPNTVCLPPLTRPFDMFESFFLFSTRLQAQAQIQYISHFTTNESMFETVEVLFNKFLKSSPCVELWSFYLSFVRYGLSLLVFPLLRP